MHPCFKYFNTFIGILTMERTHKIKKRVGVSQGGTPTRALIVQKGFLEIVHILQKYILVSHPNLKNPLMVQALHIIGLRVKGLPRTTLMEKLRRTNLLLLMVRLWSRS